MASTVVVKPDGSKSITIKPGVKSEADLEREAMFGGEPTKPKPVKLTPSAYGRLYPDVEAIQGRFAAGFDCLNPSAAVASLLAEYPKKHGALEAPAPELHASIVEKMAEGARLLDEARDEITEGYARLNELRQCLEERGNLRKQARNLRGELESATVKLNNPECCKMEDAALLKLEKRKQFIPAEIETVQASIQRLTARIQALRPGFDLARVVADLDDSTRHPNGGHWAASLHVHSAIMNGDISPD